MFLMMSAQQSIQAVDGKVGSHYQPALSNSPPLFVIVTRTTDCFGHEDNAPSRFSSILAAPQGHSMGLQAKLLPLSFLSMFRFELHATTQWLFSFRFMFLLQADKLVTFVYKLNGDEVKVDKSAYPK
jgi:hypothetical protein